MELASNPSRLLFFGSLWISYYTSFFVFFTQEKVSLLYEFLKLKRSGH